MKHDNTYQLNPGTKVEYDGHVLTIEQTRREEEPQAIYLDSYETIAMMHFITDQAGMRAKLWASITQHASEAVSPEWKYTLDNSWRYISGPAHVELAPRLGWCDRGRWIATVTGVGDIDDADAFPRYFMRLERGQLEMQEWLEHRMLRYQDGEFKQWKNVANCVHDVRDAINRLKPYLKATEIHGIGLAYQDIQERLMGRGRGFEHV